MGKEGKYDLKIAEPLVHVETSDDDRKSLAEEGGLVWSVKTGKTV